MMHNPEILLIEYWHIKNVNNFLYSTLDTSLYFGCDPCMLEY